jgi:thiamine pyrophosphate-dependent acetolactate synthase large subunit-like protein
MIDPNRALETISKHRTNDVVVTTMSTARTWPEFSQRPDLDLPLRGCMGKASSLGLGVALARPDRRVVVLDGDGSLLMNLGSLVTVAGQSPKNFVHVVLEGNSYDTSGGQPTPGEGRVDLAALAKAAGYKTAVSIEENDDLDTRWPDLVSGEGPTFVRLHVPAMWATTETPAFSTSGWKGVAEAIEKGE